MSRRQLDTDTEDLERDSSSSSSEEKMDLGHGQFQDASTNEEQDQLQFIKLVLFSLNNVSGKHKDFHNNIGQGRLSFLAKLCWYFR